MQAIISSLDQVAEALRPEYVERADGKFVLKLEGDHPSQADAVGAANTKITELTGRLDEFRTTNVRILKAIGAENVDGALTKIETLAKIDPVKYQALVEKSAALESKGVKNTDDFAMIVSREVGKVSQTLNARLDASEKKAADASEALATEKLRGTLTQAGIKASVADSAIDDFLGRATQTFKVIEGKVVAINPDTGGPLFSEVIAGQPLSPEEYAGGLQKTAPHLFKSSEGADLSGSGSTTPFKGNVVAEAEFGDNIEDIATGKATVPVPWDQ